MNALDQAIEKAGGVSKLATAVNRGTSVVGMWRHRGTAPDPASCVRIERAFGISRADLRPDDWQDIWPELVPSASDRGVSIA